MMVAASGSSCNFGLAPHLPNLHRQRTPAALSVGNGCTLRIHIPAELELHGTKHAGYILQQNRQIYIVGINGKNQIIKAVNGRPNNGFFSRSEERLFESGDREDVFKQEQNSSTEMKALSLHEELEGKYAVVDDRDTQEGRNSSVFKQHDISSLKGDGFGETLERQQRLIKDSEESRSKPHGMTIGKKEEDPYRILESGKKAYLDELDVLTLLDPPPSLVPIDPDNYNHASFIWKKIGKIPEERRHRLLDILTPRHITKMWEVAGIQHEGMDSFQENLENFLLGSQSKPLESVIWNGQATGVPWPVSGIGRFRKAFFLGKDRSIYGRVLTGGRLLANITSWLAPLYFKVRYVEKVVATEEPCNMAFEYGDGQLHLRDIPSNFPKPAKHPWPFNDHCVVYIRPVGPGVLVGQWWQEGKKSKQEPRKLLSEFVMIKNYSSTSGEPI